MNLIKKEVYESPEINIVEVKTEGLICSSPGDYDPFDNNDGSEQHSW